MWTAAQTFAEDLPRRRRHAGLERIQLVCSMNPATTLGRQPLSPRLAALMHVAYMGYPASPHLQSVLSTTLVSTLPKVC